MDIPLLLDTDIGSDIDDAVCLAYLLAQPRCHLLGITTVTGEARRRAMLASALCRVAGRADIPIYPGAEKPLLVAPRQPKAQQAEALARWDHAADFPEGEAVAFLRRAIRERPGEVVLLAIGPLTNVALLFALDPEIPALLKSLVLMCGVFTGAPGEPGRPVAEWNAAVDPHACAIVFQSGAPLRSVGLDVTRRVTMEADDVRRRFRAPLLEPVADFAEVWFRRAKLMTFHDPLAATTLFDDTICGFRRGRVAVEIADPAALGATRWRPDAPGDAPGPHEVALDVDPERFCDHFFSQFER